ncbi:ABC transporter ATP-binding protein [Halobacillus rhizosphaerae]|uniref:ATP-binding cassette domain-containing protein n=1 Tax=Halobacillus rhizosphaerae TaxID=3064889 RepID=UPI00398B1973
MEIVKCKKLTKSYQHFNVLNQVSLTITENKIVGLVGRNGAGKTTLMKIIAGLTRATSGEIEVFSKNPFNSLLVSANSLYLDDRMDFPGSLTLAEILKEAKRFYSNWDHELAFRLFDYFGFENSQFHQSLSKGKESVFNAIIGIASRCALTIFDEPATGMDAAARKDFYRALLKDYLAYPRTIIISNHHFEEMEDLIEEVILLHKGEVYLQQSVEELKESWIRLQGSRNVVNAWLAGKRVLEERQVLEETYAVAENTYSDEEMISMKREGIKVSPVSASEILLYLTKDEKGGVDDVLNGDAPQ